MTDEELDALAQKLQAETERRRALRDAPAQVDSLVQKYLAALGRAGGADWQQPSSALDAYPLGAVVTHGDITWESIMACNVWEPGVSGWREVTEDGEPAPWRQPTGAQDAYHAGDEVIHDGQTWTSDIDNNVWEPGEHGWSPTTPEDQEDPDGPDEPADPDPEDPAPEHPAQWQQPSGAHDAYQTGDRVTYEDQIWESTQDDNIWSPTDHPEGWQLIADGDDR
ncbi:hypothetical protein Q7C18_07485 [Nesterenkonia sp. CL21]|uniref:hypothetical protein n=1 Tax=Nesterenkonia sp. CL21 TaxID=3064894 RepID=UPI00287992B8|nr:hypothetical protein [Nesterenkonia sp. CL21]MDS2172531.1 hypothetical protein [Nesterenkonia sp. CL21]